MAAQRRGIKRREREEIGQKESEGDKCPRGGGPRRSRRRREEGPSVRTRRVNRVRERDVAAESQ